MPKPPGKGKDQSAWTNCVKCDKRILKATALKYNGLCTKCEDRRITKLYGGRRNAHRP